MSWQTSDETFDRQLQASLEERANHVERQAAGEEAMIARLTARLMPRHGLLGWSLQVRATAVAVLVLLLIALVAVGIALVGSNGPPIERIELHGLRMGPTIGAPSGAIRGQQAPGPYHGGGGQGLTGAAFGESSVWVTTAGGVERIDPTTNRVVATIALGAHPTRIAFGAGSVWVTVTGADQIARIDPATNSVIATIAVGKQPVGIAFAQGAVWVACRLEGALVRVDPATNLAGARIPLGRSPLNVAATPGAIWVTSDRGTGFSLESTLLRVDPSTDAVVATVPGASDQLVADAGSAWFLASSSSSVSRVDVRTNQLTARIAVHNAATDLALGGGSLWVFSSQGFVERIDPATNAIIDEIFVNLADRSLWDVSGTYGAGSAWLRSFDAGLVIRLDVGS